MAPSDTWVVAEYWATVLCGRDTPAARHAHIVSPEQSKLPGPAAPHSYGLPSWRWASAMAAAAPLLAPTAGPGPIWGATVWRARLAAAAAASACWRRISWRARS